MSAEPIWFQVLGSPVQGTEAEILRLSLEQSVDRADGLHPRNRPHPR
jgi:hypothetical protein